MLKATSKEKKLKRLENKKRSIINMISYYEKEIKSMDTKAKKDSFQSKEHHSRYLEKLKDNLLRQRDRLTNITIQIENLKNDYIKYI